MIVWPDSLSEETLKEGSSFANLAKASPIFSWSALVLGSTAISITGSGKSIGSKRIGLDGSDKVCPVIVCFKPARATMSPVDAVLISSLSFACIRSILPTLSSLSLLVFITPVAAFKVPE